MIRPQLFVTQQRIRDIDKLLSMKDFVDNGGTFIDSQHKIELAYITNLNRFYIHNGHHRCLAIYLSDESRPLYDKEYTVKVWNEQDYNAISFKNWYVTPFDILKEVRLPDFFDFKEEVRHKYREYGPDDNLYNLEKWIRNNKHLYCEPRTITTINQLAELCYHSQLKI